MARTLSALTPSVAQEAAAATTHRHIFELDGLRGIAILMVASFHFSTAFDGLPRFRLIRSLLVPGWTGVDLFFVLSGFLITGILLDAQRTGFFKRFYIRRALRIFPVYYTALLIVFLVARPWVLGSDPPRYSVIWAYFFHVSNWLSLTGRELPPLNHFWSLAVEEQFYLCWPLAVFFFDRRVLTRICIALVILAPLFRFLALTLEPEFGERIAYAGTFCRMDTLALGALLALALRAPEWRQLVSQHAFRGICAFGCVLLVWFGVKQVLRLKVIVATVMVPTGLAIFYGLLVVITALRANSAGALSRVLRSRPFQSAGRLSYAAYVVHYPILMTALPWIAKAPVEQRGAYAVAFFIGGMAVTFLLAAGSWRVMESHIRRHKDLLAP